MSKKLDGNIPSNLQMITEISPSSFSISAIVISEEVKFLKNKLNSVIAS